MATTAPPRTPTVALARELRRLGLAQGTDFRITGHYLRGERLFTYADLLNAHARQVIADNADALETALAAGPFPFTVTVRYFDSPNPWPTVSNSLGERIRDERPAAIELAPAGEAPATAPAPAFRTGDIVTADGRPGEWELMAPAGDRWEVEPAQAADRERTTIPAAALRPLADAPHVRRGDLVVQSYAEQEHAAVVGDVYRLGRWVAERTYPATEHIPEWTQLGDVDHLTVVTAEHVDSAVRLDVAEGEHQGRIVQAIVTPHAGSFRVTCRCLHGLEVCRKGRQVGWSRSVEAARELWQWHAAGAVGTAPADRLPAPAAPAPAPVTATPHQDSPAPHAPAQVPALDWRDEYRQEQQAAALGWSTRHGQAMTWAAAGRLVRDVAGTTRLVNAAGQRGRRVAAALVPPLVAAGYLVAGTGPAAVEPTEDGHRALLVWQRQRPAPVERPRKKEGLPLRPLAGGREALRRAVAFQAAEVERCAARERWYEEFDKRMAVEQREDRLNEVWGRVQGCTHRLGRKRPAGWAPTAEEAYLHSLGADVLAELRQDAVRAAGDSDRAEEVPPGAGGRRPQRRPAVRQRGPRTSSPQVGANDTPPCNLTLHGDVATMCV